MAESYIEQLLDLAAGIVALENAEGSLNKRELKSAKERHDVLEAKFTEVRNKYVDLLLGTLEGHDLSYDLVAGEIAKIRVGCDPSWNPAIEYVSSNLLPYLQKEASRDPRVRKMIKAAPWIIGVIAIIAYFGIRLLSATSINHTLETKEGIQERAAAVEKLLRYDDWMDTHVRKGGWIKGILMWPIKPTEAEIKGASEFAALAYEAQQVNFERINCPTIPGGGVDTASKEEIDYLAKVAEYLLGPHIQWQEPPVVTVLDAAKVAGKCSPHP